MVQINLLHAVQLATGGTSGIYDDWRSTEKMKLNTAGDVVCSDIQNRAAGINSSKEDCGFIVIFGWIPRLQSFDELSLDYVKDSFLAIL